MFYGYKESLLYLFFEKPRGLLRLPWTFSSLQLLFICIHEWFFFLLSYSTKKYSVTLASTFKCIYSFFLSLYFTYTFYNKNIKYHKVVIYKRDLTVFCKVLWSIKKDFWIKFHKIGLKKFIQACKEAEI